MTDNVIYQIGSIQPFPKFESHSMEADSVCDVSRKQEFLWHHFAPYENEEESEDYNIEENYCKNQSTIVDSFSYPLYPQRVLGLLRNDDWQIVCL